MSKVNNINQDGLPVTKSDGTYPASKKKEEEEIIQKFIRSTLDLGKGINRLQRRVDDTHIKHFTNHS